MQLHVSPFVRRISNSTPTSFSKREADTQVGLLTPMCDNRKVSPFGIDTDDGDSPRLRRHRGAGGPPCHKVGTGGSVDPPVTKPAQGGRSTPLSRSRRRREGGCD